MEELLSLKKAELLLVADHYKVLDVRSNMRKSEVLKKTVQWLVEEEDVLPREALNSTSTPDDSHGNRASDVEVRLRELELEKARVELQREQVSLQRAQANISWEREHDRQVMPNFDVSKYVRMVPVFEELDVERYFLHFEKIAQGMDWPRGKWSHLLQSQLKGKARDAYSALSITEAGHYDTVKRAILHAYALVPEAYRQKFRNSRKSESQSHREFARTKEIIVSRHHTLSITSFTLPTKVIPGQLSLDCPGTVPG